MNHRSFTPCVFAILAAVLILVPVTARAADNTATGNVAGVDADLANSNTFTLNTTTLALVKAAFLADGTPLATGTTLPRGTDVKFLIYVDNTTTVDVNSVNVADALDAAFAYQTGTIKIDASQNTGAAAADIYTAVDAQVALTDAVSGADAAGYNAGTVSAGDSAGNAAVTVPAGKVWAMLFTVKMQ